MKRFKMKRSTPMKKLIDACFLPAPRSIFSLGVWDAELVPHVVQRVEISSRSVCGSHAVLVFDGKPIDPADTAALLGIETEVLFSHMTCTGTRRMLLYKFIIPPRESCKLCVCRTRLMPFLFLMSHMWRGVRPSL